MKMGDFIGSPLINFYVGSFIGLPLINLYLKRKAMMQLQKPTY